MKVQRFASVRILGFALFGLFFFGSCTSLKLRSRGDLPISFSDGCQGYSLITNVNVTRNISMTRKKNHYVENLLSREINAYNPDCIANMQISTNVTFSHVILTGLTFGLSKSRNVQIRASFYEKK